MERILNAIMLLSPFGLAIIACVAFGFALAAREALGRERGLREATERAHHASLQAVTDKSCRQEEDLDRYYRLLECYADAIIAGMTELREGGVPSPGGILESFCASTPAWKRELTECTGLKPAEVERLLKSDLPMTASLAWRLEIFTGAPARYWESLWRLHEEHRMEAKPTTILDLRAANRLREDTAQAPASAPVRSSATGDEGPAPKAPATRRDGRPSQELADGSAPAAAPAPPSLSAPLPAAEQRADSSQPPGADRAAPAEPLAPRPVRRASAAVPPRGVAHPELAARIQRGGLPAPPTPRMRGPVASHPDSVATPARRAATLTDFPVQREHGGAARPNDWTEIERSRLNVTLPGVGGE
jgi:plasmid maintenance system antidote protein VapI